MNKYIKYYLAVYNLTAFGFWLAYIINFATANFHITTSNLSLLNIAQGLAVLEILHTILKWVKSPVLSTAAQVFSRILVLVLIDVFITGDKTSSITIEGICIVSIAWSITELIRYSFYFLSLLDRQPYWLLWMRYSFFIILYPLGVTGEWLIILTPIVGHPLALTLYTVFVIFLLIAYIYYFPVLYIYMWKQRKAKL